MIGGRTGFLVARTAVAAFCVLTAAYCLLAYIPFTYHQVCLGELFPWFSGFARLHPWLYWPVLAAALVSLPSLRNDRTRWLTLLFVLVYALAGFRLWAHPLVKISNGPADLVWCVLALTPLVWLAVLDWRSHPVEFASQVTETPVTARLFRACLLAAASMWVVSSASSVLRYGMLAGSRFTAAQWVAVLGWSLVAHLAVFMAAFLVLNFSGTVAQLWVRRPLANALLHGAPAVALAALVARFVVFAPLSFSGPAANAVALAVGISLVACIAGISVRLHDPCAGAMESPLALLLDPLQFLNGIPRLAAATIFTIGGTLIGCALIATSKFDWAYLMRTLVVLGGWTGAFAFFYLRNARCRPRRSDVMVVAAALFVCLYVGAVGLEARRTRPHSSAVSDALLDQYGDYEAGFRLARAALAPPTAISSDDSFYEFLAENTNLPRSVRTDPVDINLAGKLEATAAPKPNIFIFVIDSLRRDYLSPYNSAVDFTPFVAEFAHESVVFQNAFTRYAGTGLSEPSIWAGSMLLHKQYVTPFYPMNALQKLLDVEGYRQFITKDEILSAIVAPSPAIQELDAGRATMNCELCRSLAELQAKISASHSAERPIFAYTQPQNVHVSVINREGRSVPDGQAYPGFDAAYASRVRALDKCFGEFINFLKTSGLYDNSIVVLTSDHGDSLGENGHWGHAYNVAPEVVRVPLLMHLPRPAPALVSDLHSPAFLVDITPTLYYLLGHRRIERNGLFGRPLFTASAEEAALYTHDQYLIASSYGPVYAILSNGGRSLYVADGVEYKDHLYDMAVGTDSRDVSPQTTAQDREAIREAVTRIRDFYGIRVVSFAEAGRTSAATLPKP